MYDYLKSKSAIENILLSKTKIEDKDKFLLLIVNLHIQMALEHGLAHYLLILLIQASYVKLLMRIQHVYFVRSVLR